MNCIASYENVRERERESSGEVQRRYGQEEGRIERYGGEKGEWMQEAGRRRRDSSWCRDKENDMMLLHQELYSAKKSKGNIGIQKMDLMKM